MDIILGYYTQSPSYVSTLSFAFLRYRPVAEMTVVKIAEGHRDKVALLPSTAEVFEEDGSIMGQGSQFWKAVGSSGTLLTAKSDSSDSNLPPLSCGGPACVLSCNLVAQPCH